MEEEEIYAVLHLGADRRDSRNISHCHLGISSLAKPGLKFPANTGTFIAGGSVTGFITALVGTSGALRATMLQGFNIEKVEYIATASTIALGTDIT